MVDQLPRIMVIDPNSQGNAGHSPIIDSPTPAVDDSQPIRPMSSSSDGAAQPGIKKTPIKLIRNASSKTGNMSKPSSPPPDHPPTAIDPLSHHILKRTNTENTIPQKLRNTITPDSPIVENGVQVGADTTVSNRHSPDPPARSDINLQKERKKGVSFLSRFSIIGGKKKDPEDIDDDESEHGDLRTEGMDAHVFSSSIGANGYIPQHKEPPRYIKVRQHHKKEREFNRMFLAQELTGSKNRSSNDKAPGLTTSEVPSKSSKGDIKGAVWATEFSRDGKYLAAAGQDQTVRVWSVISTAEERQAHERDEDASNGEGERLSAPVFRSKPVREFEGHTSVVLDLSWSKNNFLLSSSMDKTVRLWHVSRQECLCTFKHKDFVTSIAFHPRDDRFFLAGSLDSVLRLWSIPDKSVAFWSQLPDLITAVAFTPDGKMAMAGVLGGLCLFYETEGLKYNTQIHVRSSRGKNAKGSKITGIRTCIYPPNDLNGEVKVLITSNDSRVRLYNLRDKTLEMKFRGHENSCSQIKASFSDDAKYIICGSEDRKAYVWSTGPMDSDTKDKRQVEMFEAHSDMVTAAVMAPAKTRLLLSASGDPLYDLCNPPPVTLLSRGESNISSKPPTVNDGENRNSDPVSEAASILKKPEESPAYLARSQHQDGNIIITADHTGNIKVFRQDCAFQKRRNDTWETASSFSRKIGQGKLGRASSIMTRASASSHSRRNSLGQNSISTQLPSDRILSWRNSVASNGSLETGSIRTAQTSVRSERSVSPAKVPRGPNASFNQSTPTLASTARQQPYSGTPNMSATTSPPQSLHKTTSGPRKAEAPKVTQPPTPSFSLYAATDDNNPLRLDGTGKSYQFWNMHNWRNQFGSNNSNSNNASSNSNPSERDPSRLGSNLGLALSGSKSLDTTSSVVSKLSDELEDFQEARTGEATDSEEEEAVSCQKCGGKDFRARRGGRLVCTKCGTGAAAE